MSDSITPEERLLRLIRGDKKGGGISQVPDSVSSHSKKQEPPLAQNSAQGPDKDTVHKISMSQKIRGVLFKNIGPQKKGSGTPSEFEGFFDGDVRGHSGRSRRVTQCLLGVFLLLLVYWAWDVVDRPELEDSPLASVDSPMGYSDGAVIEPVKSLSQYLQVTKRRDLFRGREKPKVKPPVRDKGPRLEDVIANLTLMGIFLDDTPQATIEERKTRKVSTVQTGDFVGSVLIEDIQEGVVRCRYNDDIFELKI